MKMILLIAAFTIGLRNVTFADGDIRDPIHDFLMENHEVEKNFYVTQLSELYLLKLDLDNSGRKSVLLSLDGYGAQGANTWQAYLPDANDSRYHRADQNDINFYFRRDRFYVGYVASVKQYGLLAFIPGKGGGDLNFYQIVNGVVTLRKIATIDFSKPQEDKEYQDYFGNAPDWKSLSEHPVTTISLDDLKKNGYDVDAAVKAAKAAISASTR